MKIERLNIFTGHSSGIYALDYGKGFLYTGSADRFVTRWDLSTNEQDKFAIQFEYPVYSLKLINNNQHLVVGLASGDLHLFDQISRKEVKFFKQHIEAVFCIQYNPVFNQFYSSDAVGNLAVWDSVSFDLVCYLPFNCGKIRRIAVSANGDTIALACQDGTIRVLDSLTFNELQTINAHTDGVGALVFSPTDSSFLYSGGKDAYIKKWNLTTCQVIKAIPAHNFMIYDLQFVGAFLVSASRDKTIKCWEPNELITLKRIDVKSKGHKHSVNAIVSIDSITFASCSDDRKVQSWIIKA